MREDCLILHVSDTHLGARQYGLIEREVDVYEVFEEIIDIALKEHVDMVVHSGDFFDTTRPPMQAVRVAVDGLRKLAEHDIPVVAVLGDHDIPKRREMPPLYLLEHLLPNVYVIGKPGREETWVKRLSSGPGCTVAGVFSHRGVRAKAVREVVSVKLSRGRGERSILVLHQSLKEVSPEHELAASDLPRGFSYYALGHIHKPAVIRVGETVAAYPGSPEALRLDEVGHPKSVLLVAVGGRGVINLEQVKLTNVRPQLVRVISAERVEDEVRKLLRELVQTRFRKKPLLHVVVEGMASPSQRKRIRQLLDPLISYVLDYRLIFEKGVNGVEGAAGYERVERIDLRSLLAERLKDEAAAELALKLLNVLGYGGQTESLREAQRVVEEWFKSRYGVKP